jgi:hypothetical protein
MSTTASTLMPALVEATLTDAQTRSVWASARGMASMRARSPLSDAFFHQGGEPADEVHAHRFRRRWLRVWATSTMSSGRERGGGHGNGAHRDALVDHRHDRISRPTRSQVSTKLRGQGGDLGVDVGLEALDVVAGAVEQVDAEGDGADVQVFVLDHLQGGQDFVLIEHDRESFLRRWPACAPGQD